MEWINVENEFPPLDKNIIYKEDYESEFWQTIRITRAYDRDKKFNPDFYEYHFLGSSQWYEFSKKGVWFDPLMLA